MRPKEKLIDPVDVDADGIAQAQAVAGAGNLTLNGALIANSVFTADYARQISITSDGNDSARTFTVTGTDPEGKAQTEAITGPNATSVESTKYWATITSIAVDAACAGNISSGTVDEFVTNVIPLNHYNSDPATVILEDFTGTINLTVEETFSRLQKTTSIQYFSTSLINETSAARADINNHATGVRLKCNSYTNGAQLDFIVNQNALVVNRW